MSTQWQGAWKEKQGIKGHSRLGGPMLPHCITHIELRVTACGP